MLNSSNGLPQITLLLCTLPAITISFTAAANDQADLPARLEWTSTAAGQKRSIETSSPVFQMKPTARGVILRSRRLIRHWDLSTMKTWEHPVTRTFSYSSNEKQIASGVYFLDKSARAIRLLSTDGTLNRYSVSVERPILGFAKSKDATVVVYSNETKVTVRGKSESLDGKGLIALSPARLFRLRHTLLEVWSLKSLSLQQQIEVPEKAIFIQVSSDGNRVLLSGLKSTTLTAR